MSSDLEYELDEGENYAVVEPEIELNNEDEDDDDEEEDDEEEDGIGSVPGIPFELARRKSANEEEEDSDSSDSSSSSSSGSSSSSDSGDDSQEDGGTNKISQNKPTAEDDAMRKLKINAMKDLSRSLGKTEPNEQNNGAGGSINFHNNNNNDKSSESEDNDEGQNESKDDKAGEYEEEEDDEEEEDHNVDPSMLNEFGVYKWPEFDGAKVKIKQFTEADYQSFQKPFQYGWKRELVLRLTSTVEKKTGDVYYHSPDGKLKLRSFVEVTNYVKRHPSIGLIPDNFTFAKQPIWRPPDEIVRQALQRGANHVDLPFYKRNKGAPTSMTKFSSKAKRFTGNEIDNDGDGDSLNDSHGPPGFGRGKRRRVLPSRYDDNEFEVSNQGGSSVKKMRIQGSLPRDSLSNGNSQDSINMSIKLEQPSTSIVPSATPTTTSNNTTTTPSAPTSSNTNSGYSKNSSYKASLAKLTAAEKRRNLQLQLYHQVHDDLKRQREEEEQRKQKMLENGETPPVKKSTHSQGKSKSKRKSNHENSLSAEQDISMLIGSNSDANAINDSGLSNQIVCSSNCPNRRGMAPNLMCSRCFCWFHLECVPEGIFFNNPPVFICSNCTTPEDKKMKENEENGVGASTTVDEDAMDIGNLSSFVEPEVQLHPAMNNFGTSISKGLKFGQNKPLMQQQTNSMKLHSLLKGGTSAGRSSIMPNNSLTKQMKHFNSAERRSKGFNKMNGGMQFDFGMAEQNRMLMNGGGMKKKNPASMKTWNNNSHIPHRPSPFQTHAGEVLRVAQTPSGHSVVIKEDKARLPMTSNKDVLGGNDMQKIMRTAKQLAKDQYQNSASNGLKGQRSSTNKAIEDRLTSFLGEQIDDGDGKLNSKTAASTPVSTKYQRYLAKKFSVLNAIEMTYAIGPKIAQYLDTKDVLSLARANRFWHKALPNSVCNRQLHLRGMTISDWELFVQNVFSSTATQVLNFEGIRIPMNIAPKKTDGEVANVKAMRMEKVIGFWKGFELIYDRLGSLEQLCFGTVPTSVLVGMQTFADQKSAEDSSESPVCWPKLTNLSVNALIDTTAEADMQPCSLDFFSKLKSFTQVYHFKLDSKFGLKLSADFEAFLATLGEFSNLRGFCLPSLKGASCDEFYKIVSRLDVNKIMKLELGSCAEWFTQDEDKSEASENTKQLFDQLSKFSKITELRLCDLVIGSNAEPLAQLFESLIIIERLTLDNIIVNTGGLPIWNNLKAIFKSLPLSRLKLSSTDATTNRAVFDVLRQLRANQNGTLKITWTATVNIDDFGHCFVPISTAADAQSTYFTLKYFSHVNNVENAADQYVVNHEENVVAVEISTLEELLNRDVNMDQSTKKEETRVAIQILPQ